MIAVLIGIFVAIIAAVTAIMTFVTLVGMGVIVVPP